MMSGPNRVLQVFARMNRGGAETMIMNIYRNIDRTKLQFDFIVHTKEKCDFDDEISSLGGEIYRMPRYNGKNHFKYKREWHDFFKKHPEYKIIHSHVRSTAAIYLEIAKKYGLITIAHSHSISSGKGIKAVVKNLLQIPIRYVADYLFACSHEAGKWLFGRKANYKIVKNGIDIDRFIFSETVRSKIRNQLGIGDKFVIGHVGRFSLPKNHSFLIEIFYEIQKHISNAVLLLIGQGSLRPEIETKVKVLGIQDKVLFIGVVPNVNDYMQAMDVFVFPSFFEGFPVVLVEAQASGLPCFVSDKITNETSITDIIRYIPLEKSPEYWAKEILHHTQNFERKSHHYKVAEAGFDIRNTINFLQEFYLKVIE